MNNTENIKEGYVNKGGINEPPQCSRPSESPKGQRKDNYGKSEIEKCVQVLHAMMVMKKFHNVLFRKHPCDNKFSCIVCNKEHCQHSRYNVDIIK